MLKIGLLGFSQGYYAQVYSLEAAATKNVDVPVVCDLGMSESYVRECAETTAEAHAQKLGARLVHTLDEFLNAGLDAAIVTSETADHADHTVACLEAGMHVFVGKPLSWRPEDVRKVMAAAERTGKVVLPGQPARYEEGLMRAVRHLRAGAVGRPAMAHVTVNHPAMVEQAWQRDPERSGGPVGEFGTYPVDILRWVMGEEPVEIMAYGGSYRHLDLGEPDGVKGLLRFPSGAIGSFDLYCCVDEQYPFLQLEVAGSQGVLRCDYHNFHVEIHKGGVAHLDENRLAPMNAREFKQFINRINGDSSGFTLVDALRVAEVTTALQESLRSGHPVAINSEA